MTTDALQILIVPGLGSSGPEHWQTLWEQQDDRLERVEQADWDAPDCAVWVKALDVAIQTSPRNVVLVAHSLGCLAVAHWAQQQPSQKVKGALLVAPADAAQTGFPEQVSGFTPIPSSALPFRSTVVASTNDEYVTLARAQEFAENWGSEFVNIGEAGHINAASGVGNWPAGQLLLSQLINQL